jgi:GT2 family glycosyltransferase
MKLSILIVNYNTEKFIENFLIDLTHQTLNPQDYEIIIVNNVQNNLLEKVITGFKINTNISIHVVQSHKNIGFGRAMNMAADNASGDLLLIANPDLQMLHNNYLEKLISQHEKHAYAGISTTKQLNENNIDSSEYTKYEFNKNLNNTNQPSWFCGALLLISKETFAQLQGFDSDFFMYCEDEDLCLRAKKAGFLLYKHHELEIFHKGGSSEPFKNVDFYQRWNKSKLLFAYKHYSPSIYEDILKSQARTAEFKIIMYRILTLFSTKRQNSLNKWLAMKNCIKLAKHNPQWLYFSD